MKIEDAVGKPVILICLPIEDKWDLIQSNRPVPRVGDEGTCTDTEAEGILLPTDAMEVLFNSGPSSGNKVWLPSYCFRRA